MNWILQRAIELALPRIIEWIFDSLTDDKDDEDIQEIKRAIEEDKLPDADQIVRISSRLDA